MSVVVVPFDLVCADLTGLAVGALRVASKNVCGEEGKFPSGVYDHISTRPVIDINTIESCAAHIASALAPKLKPSRVAGLCCSVPEDTSESWDIATLTTTTQDLIQRLVTTCKPYPHFLEWLLESHNNGNEILLLTGDRQRARIILDTWRKSVEECESFLKPESRPPVEDRVRVCELLTTTVVVTPEDLSAPNHSAWTRSDKATSILITNEAQKTTFPNFKSISYELVPKLPTPLNVSQKECPSCIKPTSCVSRTPLTVAAWGSWLDERVDGLQGKVIHGFKRGSTELGIPTANVDVDLVFGSKARNVLSLVSPGVFTGWCALRTEEGTGTIFGCVVNVGYCPFYANEKPSLEVHIYHTFANDFYGAELRVDVTGFIRAEGRYADFTDLISAIQADCEMSESLWDSLDAHKAFDSERIFRYGSPSAALVEWATAPK